ncbi:MAG TPA: antitoxin Xre-like helix-turn-helix domain-containing protein [Candidatus Elarobacter sp.]|nr:antitoxin Xre-like helix-turn-helix domain-containing protein [Candidatus Elarobacter sp.]
MSDFELGTGAPRARETDRLAPLIAEARAMRRDDPRRSQASIAMFDRIATHWALSADERETLLGGITRSTWSDWKQRPAAARLKADTRERIANLFTIDLSAHSFFAPEFADRWIRQPNAALHHTSPLDLMLGGRLEDVITVRRYIERARTFSPTDDVWEPHQPQVSGVPAEARAGISLLPAEAFADDDRAIAMLESALSTWEKLARDRPDTHAAVFLKLLDTYLESRGGLGEDQARALIDRANAVIHEKTSVRVRARLFALKARLLQELGRAEEALAAHATALEPEAGERGRVLRDELWPAQDVSVSKNAEEI